MRLNKNGVKIFWGLLFVLAAVYIVVSKLWAIPEISIIRILLAAFCVSIIFKGIQKVNFWEILFPMAFICILFDEPLGITELTPWTVLGAALLGSIGLSMIFKPGKRVRLGFDKRINRNKGVTSEQYTGEDIRFENSFGEAIKYINSDNFVRGDFENNFGAMSVYFDNAIIQTGNATAHVECNFGEVQLFIPKEWIVLNNLDHSFGSVEERGTCQACSTSTLVLNGEVNFGNAVIHYI